nr:flagellar protein FliS [uncultured Moellerella sp.]
MNSSAQALYQTVDNESQITHSTPDQIINILLKTAISRTKQAKLFIQKLDIAKKGEAINKAIDLIQTVLYADIDFSALKGEDAPYSKQYQAMIKQLMYAHLNNDIPLLEELIIEMNENLLLRQDQVN